MQVERDSAADDYLRRNFCGRTVALFTLQVRQVAAAGEKGCAAKDVQQVLTRCNFSLGSLSHGAEACGVEGPRLTTLLTALTAVFGPK